MRDYRNKYYWQEYSSELYKTIVLIYNSIDILEYINRYDKDIDYILNKENIEITDKYKNIKVISEEKILEFPTTYNIVTDKVDENLIKRLDGMGFKIYYYNNGIIENYKYLNQTLSENVLKYTNRISIELSNICNYADCHLKCPLNKQKKEKTVLPLVIIEKVIAELSTYNFSGTISFHTYNEPLIDPRLFYIISKVKSKCPNAKIYILSNGFYFNQTIADELINIGVDRIDITAYTQIEFERLKKIKVEKPYSIFLSPKIEDLDDRLDIYEEYKQNVPTLKPCYNMLNDIVITSNGQIDLCCLDWKREHCFGDLNKQSIKQIITETEMYNIFLDLAKGIRNNNICKNCLKSHTKKILDFNFNGITYRNK